MLRISMDSYGLRPGVCDRFARSKVQTLISLCFFECRASICAIGLHAHKHDCCFSDEFLVAEPQSLR